MTAAPQGVRVILLDIEGTTTPIGFVHARLFSYARERLNRYLDEHWSDAAVQEAVRSLASERAGERDATAPGWDDTSPDALRSSVRAYAHWLMDRDRKSPGLKLLQGVIWEEGYQAGALRGEVFDDVPPAIARWRAQGLLVAIYSSGSELAQRRLFESTAAGDMTPSMAGFFDTRVGPKMQPDSYRRIAAALGVPASAILFVSDVTAELAAARAAGCDTRLCVRPGNATQPDASKFSAIGSLAEIG
ncbi:MAG TPA: acireductone synthase [Vicinamibacterales bacterium]|nr:acireductone synthase [Vicinamibacterales bacterium]